MFAQIAQLVEQGTENPRVLGSIPSLGTIFIFEVNCIYERLRQNSQKRFFGACNI